MILPGDILWEQFSVVHVEAGRSGRAWLARLHGADSRMAAEAPTPLLLLPLSQPFESPLAEFLALARPALQKQNDDLRRFELGVIGAIEYRGDAGSDAAGVVLLAPPGRASIGGYLDTISRCEPARALALICRFSEKLERDFALLNAPGCDAPALLAVLSKLLNPTVLGVYSEHGALELGLNLPAATGVPCHASGDSGDGGAPPEWAAFAAPEVLRGEAAGQAALVYGVGQLARILLSGLAAKGRSSAGAWVEFAENVLGKRDASKALPDEIPQAFRLLLSKCLKPRAAARFATLKILNVALRRLKRAEWAVEPDAVPVAAMPLAKVASTERATPAGMTLVAAGTYLAGEKKVPRTLRAFAIDVTPVTEKAYKLFLKDLQRTPRPNGPGTRAVKFDDHPVVLLTWKEAEEYAAHHGKRLPTIHEWEKAARGTDGRKFPYGESYLPGTGKMRANGIASTGVQGKSEQRSSAPVGSFQAGVSPCGALDMAGNVLEWTSTGRRQGQRMFRALKGACFLDGSVELSRCAGMQFKAPDAAANYIGFRCVQDID